MTDPRPYAIATIEYPSGMHEKTEYRLARSEMEHLMTELAAELAQRQYPQHDLEFQ